MREIRALSLTVLAVTASLCDLRDGRIPNALIAAGLAMGLTYQFFSSGILGTAIFLSGAALPVILFGLLYYFRMMGAGDIKLLCMAGGFLGPASALSCIVCSVFAAGVFSLVIIVRRRIFGHRLEYFRNYVSDSIQTGSHRPYIDKEDEDAIFCFSVPVVIGILFCI